MRVIPAKGSLTPIINGAPGPSIPFWYNPETISETLTPGFTDTKIPGAPFPVKQYVGGATHEISFTVVVADLGDRAVGGSVDGLLQSYLNINLPGYLDPGGNMNPSWTPFVMWFTFGTTRYKCIVKSLTIKRKYFDQYLNTKLAEVDFKLERVFSQYVR